MRKVFGLLAAGAVAFTLIGLVGDGQIANAQVTPSCTSSQIATVNTPAQVYYSPDKQSIVQGTVLSSGAAFYVCTDTNISGWTAFEVTVPGQILFAPAGTFAGFGVSSPAPAALNVPAVAPAVAPAVPAVPVGTAGTCTTWAYQTAVNAANITYGPDSKLTTGLTVQPGTTFAVCTDGNLQGWTTFQITIPGQILYVPAGTFSG